MDDGGTAIHALSRGSEDPDHPSSLFYILDSRSCVQLRWLSQIFGGVYINLTRGPGGLKRMAAEGMISGGKEPQKHRLTNNEHLQTGSS